MATRDTRVDRGRRRGRAVVARLVGEIGDARRLAGLSQESVARLLGTSQSDVSRLERLVDVDRASVVELASFASLLGLELSANLHRAGDAVRDKGHQAVIGRFRSLLAESIRVVAEVPLPNPGDARSWDLLLRIGSQIVGVEVETRVRDIQAVVRRIRERERDGGVNAVLLVLADTGHNRAIRAELRVALGSGFATKATVITASLRSGQPLPGSGLLLV